MSFIFCMVLTYLFEIDISVKKIKTKTKNVTIFNCLSLVKPKDSSKFGWACIMIE